MKRAIKIACTINLAIAILFVYGYIAYGLSHGLPIDKHFLGSDPSNRHNLITSSGSAWRFPAVGEAIVLISLVVLWLRRCDLQRHRILCGVFGLIGLFILVLALMRADAYRGDEFDYLQIPRIDCIAGFYVWGSHVLYGLTALLDLDGI